MKKIHILTTLFILAFSQINTQQYSQIENSTSVSGLTITNNYAIYNSTEIEVSEGIISNKKTRGVYFLKLDNRSTVKFIKKKRTYRC